MTKRVAHIMAMAAIVLLSALLAAYLAGLAVRQTLQEAGRQRLNLNVAAIRAEISRNSHLPLALALNPDVPAALGSMDLTRRHLLDRTLAQISAAAGGSILYVLNAAGLTIAASNWDTPGSFVGQDYSFRPYFTQAMRTGAGRFFGIGVTTNRDGYFVANAVADRVGVVVVKIEFDRLEAAWAHAGEHIMVEDENGVVFLATNSAWKHRTLRALSPDRLPSSRNSQQYAGAELLPLPRRMRADGTMQLGADDARFLDQVEALPDFGWTLHRLTPWAPVLEAQWVGALVGASVSALLTAIVLYARLRNQVLHAAQAEQARLEKGVQDRTRMLDQLNRDLRAAQDGLVRAERLVALGKMSAVLVHEINQPLTAMGFELGSLRILARRTAAPGMMEGLDALSRLAERLADMTGQLKIFARTEARTASTPTLHPVPVCMAVQQALAGLGAQLAVTGVRVELDCAEEADVLAESGQLQQVFGNVLRNALDAVSDGAAPWIGVCVTVALGVVRVQVADNGSGFSPGALDRAFEPFFTTKALGAGLGLGLSISYRIVDGFAGTMRVDNREAGGAEVFISLRRAERDRDE